ncbi:hypothetical protein LJC27_01395 [Christensenellaceae bacterium OttesenSCG-928-M15]|nr:hypothetical protein [Christensenellaceae bacterium OttesenSCG-928-M15]
MENMENRKEIEELEEKLTKLEVTINVHYCELGKNLLDLVEMEQRAINRMVDEMIDIRKKLVTKQRAVQCQSCMAFNTADSTYCKRCGIRLEKFEFEMEKEKDDGEE